MKRNIMLRLLACLCLVGTCLLSLAACGKEQTDPEKTFTVIFDTAGGSSVAAQEVKEGAKAVKPSDPVREGYIFLGWKRENLAFSFDFPINANTTLTADWISSEALFSYRQIDGTDQLILTGLTQRSLETEILYLPALIKGLPVTGIDPNAFANLSAENIPTLVIPESVTSIGEGAFSGCVDVRIRVLGTLTEIGESAFANCNGLEAVSIGDGPQSIPFHAFSGCSSLLTVQIPKSVKVIEENAFMGCSSVITVVLPDGMERIEDSAFIDCESIKTLFFGGTAEEDLAAVVGNGNAALTAAKRYVYSEAEPTDSGLYWYWDGNTPKIWKD